jgi:hypothetical protein
MGCHEFAGRCVDPSVCPQLYYEPEVQVFSEVVQISHNVKGILTL